MKKIVLILLLLNSNYILAETDPVKEYNEKRALFLEKKKIVTNNYISQKKMEEMKLQEALRYREQQYNLRIKNGLTLPENMQTDSTKKVDMTPEMFNQMKSGN